METALPETFVTKSGVEFKYDADSQAYVCQEYVDDPRVVRVVFHSTDGRFDMETRKIVWAEDSTVSFAPSKNGFDLQFPIRDLEKACEIAISGGQPWWPRERSHEELLAELLVVSGFIDREATHIWGPITSIVSQLAERLGANPETIIAIASERQK